MMKVKFFNEILLAKIIDQNLILLFFKLQSYHSLYLFIVRFASLAHMLACQHPKNVSTF